MKSDAVNVARGHGAADELPLLELAGLAPTDLFLLIRVPRNLDISDPSHVLIERHLEMKTHSEGA
jgi:hypothetical protein